MTSLQLSIFDPIGPVGPASETHDGSIREAFDRFHRDHPEVYRGLVALCRRWRENGADRWSIDGAFEVLRWTLRETTPDARESYRLNNNYRAHFARLIMATESDLADIFETRELQSAMTTEAYIYGMRRPGDRYAHILGGPNLGICGASITLQPLEEAEAAKRVCPDCAMYARAARQSRAPFDPTQLLTPDDANRYHHPEATGEADSAASQAVQ